MAEEAAAAGEDEAAGARKRKRAGGCEEQKGVATEGDEEQKGVAAEGDEEADAKDKEDLLRLLRESADDTDCADAAAKEEAVAEVMRWLEAEQKGVAAERNGEAEAKDKEGLLRLLKESADDTDCADAGAKEEAVAEVMRWLEAEQKGVAAERDGEADAKDKEGLLLLLKETEDAADRADAGAKEAAVAEVMRWLDADITADDASAGFVTINGNEESCGPSFSCAASTVMAAVDTRAGAPPPPPVPWPFPEPEPELVPDPAAAKTQQEKAAEVGADDDDAAWLDELLLACGPDGV